LERVRRALEKRGYGVGYRRGRWTVTRRPRGGANVDVLLRGHQESRYVVAREDLDGLWRVLDFKPDALESELPRGVGVHLVSIVAGTRAWRALTEALFAGKQIKVERGDFLIEVSPLYQTGHYCCSPACTGMPVKASEYPHFGCDEDPPWAWTQ